MVDTRFNPMGNSFTRMARDGHEQLGEKRIFLTVNDIAERYQISKKTIYGWIYRRLITPIRVGPRLVRFDQKEVEKWISRK